METVLVDSFHLQIHFLMISIKSHFSMTRKLFYINRQSKYCHNNTIFYLLGVLRGNLFTGDYLVCQ